MQHFLTNKSCKVSVPLMLKLKSDNNIKRVKISTMLSQIPTHKRQKLGVLFHQLLQANDTFMKMTFQ